MRVMPKSISFSAKLTMMMGTLAIASATLIGVLTYSDFNSSLTQREIKDLGSKSHVAGLHLKKHIDSLRQDMSILSNLPQVHDIILAAESNKIDDVAGPSTEVLKQQLAKILFEILHAKPEYLHARYIGMANNGMELVRVDQNDGDVRIVPDDQLQEKAHRSYFKETISLPDKAIYLSEINLNREQGKIVEPHTPVLRAARPIYSKTGKVFGIVIINLDMRPIFSELLESKQSDLNLYIANDRGDFLVHPNPNKQFGFEFGQSHNINDAFPGHSQSAGAIVKDNESIALNSSKVVFDPLHPDRFITIAMTVPYDQVIASSNATRNKTLVTSVLLLSAALIMCYILFRSLTKPLRVMAAAVDAVSSGRSEQLPQFNATCEFQILSQSFDKMLSQVKEQKRQWEDEVKERNLIENEMVALARIPEENPSPIMRLSHDAKVLYANPACRKLLTSWGSTERESLGSWWVNEVSQALKAEDYRDVVFEQNGSIFEFRMTPVKELNYVNLWGYNITDRIRAEKQRTELTSELQANTEELERQKAHLIEEIDQRMGSEATARHDATHDTLTGLSNRAMLMDRIDESLIRSKEDSSYKFALLFLDFDRFKLVNDSLGHDVGDQLLISIANRLKGNLRTDDVAQSYDDESIPEQNVPTRLGGDEFVVLLEHVNNINDAIHVANRLQKALEEPHTLGKHEVTSTASIGIVISDSTYETADEMLRDADTAMYSAKAAGKAQHKVFDKTMHDQATDRLQLENDLRTALQKEQFRILYQPIVELETGQITGFEALLRWEHPTKGLISPIDFIPVAEETGLIVPIGGWVLLEATQQLKKWQKQFPREEPLSMNVNISKRQLTQPDLVDTVQKVLLSNDIPPYTLKLEVTESAIMSDMEQLTPILHNLRSLGLHICIDDFGTGQSSLSCLHMFAVDVLKIDRYFLVTMGESREYAAVTQAIVTLAHNLGMDVVAEGVETADQVVQLQALETDHAQGYYFARPITPKEIETLMQNAAPLIKTAA